MNWTFWWHPEPIVPLRIFWLGWCRKGLIIGKIIVEQSNEIAWSERWNARLITRFYNGMLNTDQYYRTFLGDKMYLSFLRVSRKQWFLKYISLRTISTKELWQNDAKHKPFSDLLDLVCTLQHSISIHLKMMSISKKKNKLTSLFISNILFIRLQIRYLKSRG